MGTKTTMARNFMKTSRQGQCILAGKYVEIIDMHPGERMMLLVDLAEAAQFNASAASKTGFTKEMSTNLFRFLNMHFSWQETVVFIHLINRHLDVSFSDIMASGLPECDEFYRRMSDYLRGTI